MATRIRKTVVAAAVEGASAPSRRPRRSLKSEEPAEELSYFASVSAKEAAGVEFFSSGCATFDCALGGGWAHDRVSNVVGDKSAGKTLIAIEAAANFKRRWPNGLVRYAESEWAFTPAYAEAMGMPKDTEYNKSGKPIETVEEWAGDVERVMQENKGRPVLYILDSMDALSDAAEMDAEFGEDSYGGKKPKLIGQFFRREVDNMGSHPMHMMIVSQIRENIGAMFGEKHRRSGGKALDFYASQIVWVHHQGQMKKTIAKIDRVVGVEVKAKVKKNKVGLPFREASYPILFGYGMDDLTSSVEWLLDNGREQILKDEFDLSRAGYKVTIAKVRDRGGPEARELREKLRAAVFREWEKVEVSFLPKSRKYDD
jgi:protein RecA